MEILGYDIHSKIVGSADPNRKLKWEEIGPRSAKVIGFTDLAVGVCTAHNLGVDVVAQYLHTW